MITAGTIFTFIVSALKAIPIVDKWFQQLISYYLVLQTQATRTALVDAASLAARATTDDERYKASATWQTALQRPRVS